MILTGGFDLVLAVVSALIGGVLGLIFGGLPMLCPLVLLQVHPLMMAPVIVHQIIIHPVPQTVVLVEVEEILAEVEPQAIGNFFHGKKFI